MKKCYDALYERSDIWRKILRINGSGNYLASPTYQIAWHLIQEELESNIKLKMKNSILKDVTQLKLKNEKHIS
jgi:hypothetical protein